MGKKKKGLSPKEKAQLLIEALTAIAALITALAAILKE